MRNNHIVDDVRTVYRHIRTYKFLIKTCVVGFRCFTHCGSLLGFNTWNPLLLHTCPNTWHCVLVRWYPTTPTFTRHTHTFHHIPLSDSKGELKCTWTLTRFFISDENFFPRSFWDRLLKSTLNKNFYRLFIGGMFQ